MLPSQDDYEISPTQLAALKRAPDPLRIRLIDCREEDEFFLCRIKNAELRPLSRFAEEAPNHLLNDPETPMFVYCHHGIRSMQATLLLRQWGKANVWSLAGGIDLWAQEIDPAVNRY